MSLSEIVSLYKILFINSNRTNKLFLLQSDVDCQDDLECFQRDGDGPRPPGCGGGSLSTQGYDYCYDPFCSQQLERLEVIRSELSNEGIDSVAVLDESIELLFGNKTTIGQICAYSKGLEEVTVDDIPGFCCRK